MKTKSLIIVILFFVSCSQSTLKNNLEKEYERLADKTGQQITVNQINLLKIESLDFEKLASFEIQKLEEINELRKSEIQTIEEMNSLINVKVNHQKCLVNNANSENKVKHLQEIESDSIRLVKSNKRLFQLKLGKLKDEVKLLEIFKLSKLKSIQNSKNLIIKHTIDIIIDSERIIDTLQYISFNNQNYNYFNRDLFIEER